MILYECFDTPEELDEWDDAHYHVPYYAYIYMVNNYNKIIPKEQRDRLEATIAKSATESYYYAAYILQDRFLLGESAILTNRRYNYVYLDVVVRPKYGKTNPHFVDQMENYVKSTGSMRIETRPYVPEVLIAQDIEEEVLWEETL